MIDEGQPLQTPTLRQRVFTGGLLIFFLFLFGASYSSVSDILPSGPMMKGLKGWTVTPLFTVGEKLPSIEGRRNSHQYQPVGILDGIGAFRLSGDTVRVFINHELEKSTGYPYILTNGTVLSGARISFVDVDRSTRTIVNSGMAYDSIVDRQGRVVSMAEQINQSGSNSDGFSRFCSATFLESGTYGFLDNLYFVGEEVGDPLTHPYGGSLWVLDVGRRTLHGMSAAGRMNFENIAPLQIDGDRVAMLIGDDTTPQTDVSDHFGEEANETTPVKQIVAAPLWLYIGRKNASLFEIRKALPPGIQPPPTDVLNRNGLLVGKLYYFVAEGGMTTVSQFKGTRSVVSGIWREVEVHDPSKAKRDGFDDFGYKNGFTLRREAKAGGAFQFSRPEDVSTQPSSGTRVAFASTGRASVYDGHDSWGTIYQVDVDLDNLRATLTILYDGDDAVGNQVESPDHGIRSPDNLDWARDGFIYVQEDNAKVLQPYFGSVSRQEASIWRLNPETGETHRIAQMDPSRFIPAGAFNQQSHNMGSWESSGILDVSELFRTKVRETLLLATVQAHTLKDGIIQKASLVEGGQLIFLQTD